MSLIYEWNVSHSNTNGDNIITSILESKDKILISQLMNDIVNKLTKLNETTERFIYLSDQSIVCVLRNIIDYKKQWSKKKIYTVCANIKYNHIISLIQKISRFENKQIISLFQEATNFTNKKVLDVGCLDENLTKLCYEKLANGVFRSNIDSVYGIDIKEWQDNDYHVYESKETKSKYSINFTTVSNEYSSYPYNNNNFCLITCFNVLHHVREPNYIVSEIYRVLAPGGYLIIKEHDVTDNKVAQLCYSSHLIRQLVLEYKSTIPDRIENTEPYFSDSDSDKSENMELLDCWFRNRFYWDKLYLSFGFKILSHYYQPNNTLKTYYTLLQK